MGKDLWKPSNLLYPVPAVMVSCARPGEKPNIITVAWTGTVCSEPPMLSVSVTPRRYSHAILTETREFVVNLTTASLCRAADFCGVRSGRDTDKFRETGLTPEKAPHLEYAPAILESPVSLECRVKEIVSLGSHDLFLAEILGVLVDPRYVDESGRLALEKTDPAVYSHGFYYRLGEALGRFGFSVKKEEKRKKGRS